jgi:hypothetical protein
MAGALSWVDRGRELAVAVDVVAGGGRRGSVQVKGVLAQDLAVEVAQRPDGRAGTDHLTKPIGPEALSFRTSSWLPLGRRVHSDSGRESILSGLLPAAIPALRLFKCSTDAIRAQKPSVRRVAMPRMYVVEVVGSAAGDAEIQLMPGELHLFASRPRFLQRAQSSSSIGSHCSFAVSWFFDQRRTSHRQRTRSVDAASPRTPSFSSRFACMVLSRPFSSGRFLSAGLYLGMTATIDRTMRSFDCACFRR